MVSTQKKYLGILGGSFDPAHKGHLGISNITIKKLKLNKIYWIITKKNPFKKKTFYSLNERIKYAKKLTETQKKIKIIYLDNIIKSSRTIDVNFPRKVELSVFGRIRNMSLGFVIGLTILIFVNSIGKLVIRDD